MLKPGIYEQAITKAIRAELQNEDIIARTEKMDSEEAARILASHAAEVIEDILRQVKDSHGRIHDQIMLCNRLLEAAGGQSGLPETENQIVGPDAEMLLAVMDKHNSIYGLSPSAPVPRPDTSIAQSSLFTGAAHEPSLYQELKKEIMSCDRFDMLVSFIKWSGLRLLMDELQALARHKKIRVITTSYMGATDARAIKALAELPNTDIKISYDTKRTRLHAKTYIFHRDNGYSTAYVGSSNLSYSALSEGLEWNIKLAAREQPETMKKIEAIFESYWNHPDFISYQPEDHQMLEKALYSERRTDDGQVHFAFDIRPFRFQEEILERLEAERQVHDRWRNLVVAATGTGKTVISAFDYKRFRNRRPYRTARLLFIAHREEILQQSRQCFRSVLKDQNFGELLVGGHRPGRIDHLFMSIQSFNSTAFHEISKPDFYDFIVVDEFHHAAAPSYQYLLEHYNPVILLGLTATPERMDGRNVVEYFDNHLAAEVRLPEAIDRQLLCPFQYFGVADSVDLDAVTWSRGGYDRRELSNLYSMSGHIAKQRAVLVIQSLLKYVTEVNEVKGLGFCVSIAHAEFMAGIFHASGIPAMHLTADSSTEERRTAQQNLVAGKIKIIFVVNLYNEGIDIPEVNTILFLRPTESLTVFLQQLGRGLRFAENKDCLTVLDFVGQANRRYNFTEKYAALLGNTRRSVQREIRDGFTALPRGCFIQLEPKARECILNNIRHATSHLSGLLDRLRSFEEDSGQKLNLGNFTDYHHLDIVSLLKRGSLARLMVKAGMTEDFQEPDEKLLTSALPRICLLDSKDWLDFLLDTLASIDSFDETRHNSRQTSWLRMFYYTIWQKPLPNAGFSSLADAIKKLAANPVILGEIMDILKYCRERISFVGGELAGGFASSLELHCTYSRDQVLAALDVYTDQSMPAMREGVKYLAGLKTDVFFITLNKAEKDYSPSTMYNDYSISEDLFHWQSQSTTSEASPTGQRYINHRQMGSQILLFVREYKRDAHGLAAPYTCLGLADYVQHEGSRPMNVIWRLHRPIPARFMNKTNKLITG